LVSQPNIKETVNIQTDVFTHHRLRTTCQWISPRWS